MGVTDKGATNDPKTLTKADLYQFTGSIVWYVHSLVRNMHYTDGVRYVAQTGGAYWLVDEIAFAQAEDAVKAESFKHWMLKVTPDHTATLTCGDGNDGIVYTKHIEFTDFPMDEMSFYCTDNVILLPGEY